MKTISKFALCALSLCAAFVIHSCTEEIDESDRYTFTGYTVSSYLESHEEYSEYYRLISEVLVSSRSESTVQQLLSARGNYTVFAPDNQAIQEYLDTLYRKDLITEPSWEGFDDDNILDSIKKVIVYNSIIDGGDDTEAYETGSFPSDNAEFLLANMNDRKLTVNYGNNPDSIYIDGTKDTLGIVHDGCLLDMINRDIYAVNGYIHEVHTVVAPSNESIGELLNSYVANNTEGFLVTAKIVLACGLLDTLTKIRDETYEQMYLTGQLSDLPTLAEKSSIGYLPEHRKYGYTIFAETDDFWSQTLGKTPEDITVEDVKEWVISKDLYPTALTDDDYSDEENVLNQFVTYHILPMRISSDKLVIHYNEKGYVYTTSTNYTVAVNETYTTMGKKRLFTLYQVGNLEGIYINRFPNLDNSRTGTYQELSCDDDKCGFYVDTGGAINVVNGYIYPISAVNANAGPATLAYNQDTRDNFQKHRWRYDVASLFPEFMNNDIRANRIGTARDMCVGIPINADYKYLDNTYIEDGTNFYYYLGLGKALLNYQGDGFYINGRYEVTFPMPPVPAKGTYEVRFLVSNTSSYRGMCQVYFGTDTENLYAMGIPLDLRLEPTSDFVGWVEDTGDEDTDAETDKKMRNNDFMKAPEHYTGIGYSEPARAQDQLARRIIVRQDMEPDRQYYLKFKNVLDSETLDLKFDYFEVCPKEVYDNPNTPEDIW